MDNSTLNFVFLFQTALSLLLFGSVYYCLKHREASRIYWAFAKNLGALFICIELVVLLMQQAMANSWIVLLHFISIVLSVMGGMLLSRRLNIPSLPILICATGARKRRLKFKGLQYIKVILINASLLCAFTIIFFKCTRPELSDFLKQSMAGEGASSMNNKVLLSSIIFFVLVAFYEEIVFRLFTLTFFTYVLRKFNFGPPLAMIASSLLFALGHYGILATWWIKFTQTFVMGLALSFLMRRYGMETSFSVHAILNIFALYSSSLLLNHQ